MKNSLMLLFRYEFNWNCLRYFKQNITNALFLLDKSLIAFMKKKQTKIVYKIEKSEYKFID